MVPGSPLRRFRRLVLFALIAVLILIVVVAVAGVYVYDNSQNVDVRAFLSASPNNTCGLESYTEAWAGFNDTPGTTIDWGFEFLNANTTGPCTPTNLTTDTPGFSVFDVSWNQTSVPASPSPFAPNDPNNGMGEVSFALAIPGSSWSGDVLLIFS